MRLAGVALAAAWFRHDHGRLPAALDELVPGYLPEVPGDPMSGRPLRCDTADGRPRVRAAGIGGRDGPAAYLDAGPQPPGR